MHRHSVSDHLPLYLCFKCKIVRRVSKWPPPFRFNVSILNDKNFYRKMKMSWLQAKEGFTDPYKVWEAGVKAITILAK